MSEPDPHAPARRRFTDAGYAPLCASLAELRAGIDAIDDQVVALLARRAMLVMDATRFKRDAHEAAAPARQRQVFERVRGAAHRYDPGFPGFPDLVEATWRTMVAGFVAHEQALLARTEPIDEGDTNP